MAKVKRFTPALAMLRAAKARAKQKGLPFNLVEEDIHVPIFCPVLGIKLESGTDKKMHDASPTLDRIVPELGYVRGNILVVSSKANRMKSDGNAEELRRLADFYTKLERDTWTTSKSNGANTSATSTASPNRSPRRTVKTLSKSSVTLLIDGDMFAYRAAFGTEEAIMIDDDTMTYKADIEEARIKVEEMIDEAATALKADRIIVCLSHDENFRQSIYPDYKMNRVNNRRPLALKPTKQFLIDTYETKIKKGLEADDVIGILMTHPKLLPGKKIAVSGDKDMRQIPGRHYNHLTGEKAMIAEPEANHNFYRQVLTGDSVDNYPGLPGVGPKRADAIFNKATMHTPAKGTTPDKLQDAIDVILWRAIHEAFVKKGLTEEDAITQARVARILRASDYDFKRKEPILWTPPQ